MICSLFFLLQAPLLVFGAEVLGKNKAESKGVLLMDSVTFPVLMDELSAQTRLLVGIFDKRDTVVSDPPTLEAEARFSFLNFAQAYNRDESTDLAHLLFGQVIVNGAENRYLKNRLVGDRQLPVFIIIGENRTDPTVVDLDLRDYRYCTFISLLNTYAGYKNALPGVLEQFEPLLAKFVPGTPDVRRQVIKEAKDLYDSIDDKKIIADADFYVKTMEKVMEQGIQYVKEEGGSIISRARLPMVNAERSYNLDKKLNILESFLKEYTPEPIREAALPYLKTKDELAQLHPEL